MKRSSSADEFLRSVPTARGIHRSHRSMVDIDGLPISDPQSFIGKKEARRTDLTLLIVHAIPVVVFSCFIVLWFLSS